MSKRKWMVGSVLAGTLVAASAVGLVQAHGFEGCRYGRGPEAAMFGLPGGHGDRILHEIDRLGLSDEQREQAWAVNDEQRAAARKLRWELREGLQGLRDSALNEAYDPAQVQALAKAQADLMARLIVLRAEGFHRLYALLTPEQQAQLKEWREKRPEHTERF
jgi:Spy/CpxP family protein refolding chaperone